MKLLEHQNPLVQEKNPPAEMREVHRSFGGEVLGSLAGSYQLHAQQLSYWRLISFYDLQGRTENGQLETAACCCASHEDSCQNLH